MSIPPPKKFHSAHLYEEIGSALEERIAVGKECERQESSSGQNFGTHCTKYIQLDQHLIPPYQYWTAVLEGSEKLNVHPITSHCLQLMNAKLRLADADPVHSESADCERVFPSR
jgi:hypothetical protein